MEARKLPSGKLLVSAVVLAVLSGCASVRFEQNVGRINGKVMWRNWKTLYIVRRGNQAPY